MFIKIAVNLDCGNNCSLNLPFAFLVYPDEICFVDEEYSMECKQHPFQQSYVFLCISYQFGCGSNNQRLDEMKVHLQALMVLHPLEQVLLNPLICFTLNSIIALQIS